MADRRVELIISLLGYDASMRSLNDFKRAAEQLNGYKIQPQIELRYVERTIDGVRQRLQELRKEKAEIRIKGDDVTEINQRIANMLAHLKDLNNRKTALKLELGDLRLAEQYCRQIVKELGAVENAATKAGSALSSIGKAFGSVAQVFQNISGLTNSSVLDTIERYATVMTTRMFAQDWSAAFTRFDILNTYSDYLQMVGVSAEEASASLDKINAGIQGIPVGLSDVAYQTRMYQMYLDDMERSTNLAVGLERALVAGGANEQMRNTARYEIDRLLSAGELSTSRQYRALMQGLGVSSRFLREEMGYGDLKNAEFINQLFKKQISGDELIRGLESLASSDKLNAAIETYRTTIESGLSNIRFALTRGKANILSELNSTLDTATGKNISGWLYEIRDGINEVYKSIARYIAQNPQMIRNGVDTILGALERLRSFDWGNLFSELGNSVGKFINVLGALYDALPKGLFTDLIVFSTVWAGPIANAFNMLYGVFTLFGGALSKLGTGFAILNAAPAGSLLAQFAALGPVVLTATAALASFALIMKGIKDDSVTSIADRLGLDALDGYEGTLTSLSSSIDAAKEAMSSFAGSPADRLTVLQDSQSRLKTSIRETREQLRLAREEYNRLIQAQEEVTQADWDEIDFMSGRDDYSAEIDTTLRAMDDYTAKIREAEQAQKDLEEAEKRTREEMENPLPVRNYSHGYDESDEIAAREKEKVSAYVDGVIEKWEKTDPAIAESIRNTRSEIQGLTASYYELRDAAEKAIAKQVDGFEKLEKAKTVGIGTTKENIDSQTAVLKDYNDSMTTILGWWQQNKQALGELGDEYAGIMSSLASGGLENAGFARGLAEAIEGKNFKDVTALLESYRDKMAEEAAAVDMTAVAQAIAENYSEAMHLTMTDFENFGSIYDMLLGGETGDTSKLVEGLLQPLQDVRELIGSEEGLVGAAASLDDQFNKIATESLPMLYEAVSTTAADSETAMTTSATNIETTLTAAIDNIISALERLKQKFTETANHAVNEFQKIIQKAREVVQALQEIMSKLQELDGTHVTVYIDYVESGSPGDPGGGGSGTGATGGLIDGPGPAKYYAKGGSVFDRIFKQQGTDTVPAMLTPGEYVLRKKAVDTLGVPFLRRLNRLDIAGAFDNLMSRMYIPSITSSAAYYNTYNNTDSRSYDRYDHTWNIQTNNPDLPYMVASRWAHAL